MFVFLNHLKYILLLYSIIKMSNTLTQQSQSTIKQVPYSKGILETIRKRMDKEDYNFLLCETTPDGLYHKEYWMCKNQDIVNDFLDF